MIYQNINSLIKNAIQLELIEEIDEIYSRNQILSLLQLQTWPHHDVHFKDTSIPELLDEIVSYAIKSKIINNLFDEKEILKANIMNCLVARPSVINEQFYKRYKESPRNATDYFYKLSKNSNYIQTKQTNKNIHFCEDTKYGQMDITINLSKPEKDPESIKKELEAKANNIDYPKCVLCRENEGYEGRIGYPARANHRVIHVPLLHEDWYLQYSPYIYYHEHSILFSKEHRNMVVNRSTFERFLEFVEKFPHYFIGSNADLPIVGGSILSHDHYQAGNYRFGMLDAKESFTFNLKQFKHLKASVLYWPLTVIRLKGEKESVIEASNFILNKWRNYTDEKVDIIAFTGDTPHNTITPIARKNQDSFQMDLVLRNNRTTEEYPSGIFHPHEDVQHIKKENIGLIEVMGLAILPARLKHELEDVKQYLLKTSNNINPLHEKWAMELQEKYVTFNHIDAIIQKELGLKFTKILEDAGVFKQNEQGQDALKRFITTLDK